MSRITSSSSMTSTAAFRRMLDTCALSLGGGGGRIRRGNETKFKSRALAGHAVTLNRRFVLADDSIGDRQAEAGALAHRLGGEERIVNAREVLSRNAVAGVGDLGDGFAAFDARRNRQPAAARHRIARVEEQVQEHLLELELVADHVDGRGVQLAPDLDAALFKLMFEQ